MADAAQAREGPPIGPSSAMGQPCDAASQLSSASAAHELDVLHQHEGESQLTQAFWDALPLETSSHDQGQTTNSNTHTPTMEDLHAVMSHGAYTHEGDSSPYNPFDPPQLNSAQQHVGDPTALLEPLPSGTSLRESSVVIPVPAGEQESDTTTKNRKDSHKEIERKRREQMTNGINEIAALLPPPTKREKNKTLILTRTAEYIRQLKQEEVANNERWAMEKAMMEVALGDLRNMVAEERAKRKEAEEALERAKAAFPLVEISEISEQAVEAAVVAAQAEAEAMSGRVDTQPPPQPEPPTDEPLAKRLRRR